NHTRVEVGASRAYPSADTHSTSSKPCAVAQRWQAMFTAYDKDFTPPSSHGAAARAAAGNPRLRVPIRTPSRRTRRVESDTGVTMAYTVGDPPPSGPRVQTR